MAPRIRYSDNQLTIETGIDANAEFKNAGEPIEYVRPLSNCIKISSTAARFKLIQFVTRQVLDRFEYRRNGTVQWDEEPATYYMSNDTTPKWKVDVLEDCASCYYDDEGLVMQDEDNKAVYDYPGGSSEPHEERATFATFVILNDNVTHLVKWSKQYNINEEEFYSVAVEECTHLPQWAIRSITENYNDTNHRPYPLENHLLVRAEADSVVLSKNELDLQAQEDFLLPPEEWQTKQKHPSLFSGHDKTLDSKTSFDEDHTYSSSLKSILAAFIVNFL